MSIACQPTEDRRARRKIWRAVPAVLVAGGLAIAGLAPAKGAGADAASEQRDVKRQRAAVAAEVDTLKASDAEVSSALADLEANVRSSAAQLADARRAVANAEARAAQADRDAQATEGRIAELRRQVVATAVDAYKQPYGEGDLIVLQASTAREAGSRRAFLDVANGGRLDAADALSTEKRRLEDQRAAAQQARDAAEQRREALQEKARGYEQALGQQQKVAAQVEERLNEKLAESESLAALDQQLSARVAAEQAALARQLAAARAAADRAAAGPARSGPSSPPSRGGPVTIAPAPGGLVTVRGITVAASIASNLAAMLEAASADGIELGGSGYRDPQRQIELRRQNCGTSEYAIWQMNPDSCTPPTAIPGRSKHEQGLAVDFSVNGRVIQSRSEPAFQWLAANAGRYGFANLPSEPWHWSPGGQ